jgi:transketolase
MIKRVTDIKRLEILSDNIREDIIKMLVEAGSGHSAGPLGMADVFTALYFNIMDHNPKDSEWKDRDRFILSNGHICPLLYAVLARSGYFSIKELSTLRKLGSILQGHPHRHSAPGIETSTGPLGQGSSVAAGIAYGAKMDKKRFKVFLSMGDGECDEGQCWETFMFAGKNKLDNLIAFIDRNFIQIDGNTEQIMPLEPLADKIRSFNWNVQVINGNNMKQIISAFSKAKKSKGKPNMVICKTVPGKGVSFMERRFEWHGKVPVKDEALKALHEICEHECKLRKWDSQKCKMLINKCGVLE